MICVRDGSLSCSFGLSGLFGLSRLSGLFGLSGFMVERN
jgi:hypothetical protein